MIALILALASGQVSLQNEGASLGQINVLNCVGAGVDCTRSGTTGTVTASGGGSGGGVTASGTPAATYISRFTSATDITGSSGFTSDGAGNVTINAATPRLLLTSSGTSSYIDSTGSAGSLIFESNAGNPFTSSTAPAFSFIATNPTADGTDLIFRVSHFNAGASAFTLNQGGAAAFSGDLTGINFYGNTLNASAAGGQFRCSTNGTCQFRSDILAANATAIAPAFEFDTGSGGSIGTDDALFMIKGGSAGQRWMLDQDGDTFQTGAATATAFLGNASTATALAANPTDCSVAGEFATGIAANGNLTCATPATGSGSGNSVEASLAITDVGVFSATVAATWVAAGTEIICSPFATDADGQTVEIYDLAEFSVTASNRVAGVSFDLRVYSPNGVTGTFRFHCLGV